MPNRLLDFLSAKTVPRLPTQPSNYHHVISEEPLETRCHNSGGSEPGACVEQEGALSTEWVFVGLNATE